MPIRLNLLAEAQAAEEMRRRDPVKRALWGTALVIALMLAWSSSLQLKTMLAYNKLADVAAQVNLSTNAYQRVLENKNKTAETERKLAELRRLTTNRFLYGTVLNALQLATVEDVRLVRLKAEQNYVVSEATKNRTNADERVVLGRPGGATEKILLTLDGIDSSASPGDQVNRLMEALKTNAYFGGVLARTNPVSLKSLSPPQVSPDGKPCVAFTLECRYPERTR